jgi:hypothetical protein
MIRLSRSELWKLAASFILANTAPSLYQALLKSDAVRRLARECGRAELASYYDRLTARARRTEIEMGLAYGILVAALRHEGGPVRLDVSRLRWGSALEELTSKSEISTQRFVLEVPPQPPRLDYRQHTEAPHLIIPGMGNRPDDGECE